MNQPETNSDREIIIVRKFNAPRELVWEAMTNPRHVDQWFGPRGVTVTTKSMEVRPGGSWRFVMRVPGGGDYRELVTYREVTKPSRLVYTHGSEEEPEQFEVTATFTEENGKTTLTWRSVFPTAAARDYVIKHFNATESGNQTLTKLSEYLSGMLCQPFVISREFDAPRELVWKAWTEPERLLQWFGPKGTTTQLARMDFRVGGVCHYGQSNPSGKDMWGKFVYREIVPPGKIILVNSFSDPAGGITRHPFSQTWPLEMLTEVTFTERDGKTTVTVKWLPLEATEAERKAFNDARDGMKQGWTGTFELLAVYLAEATKH